MFSTRVFPGWHAISLLIICCTSTSAFASDFDVNEALTSSTQFQRLVMSKWTFKCTDSEKALRDYDGSLNPNLVSGMLEFTTTTLFEGFTKLYAINSQFTKDLVTNIAHRKLTIRCEFPKIGLLPGTFAAYAPSPKLCPGIICQDKVYFGLISYHILSSFLGYSFPEDYVQQIILMHRNALFHEFLHFAEADNFSTDFHNNVSEFSLREVDVVYACSAQVFSTQKNAILEKNDLQYSNTRLACYTCSNAKFGVTPKPDLSGIVPSADYTIDACESLPNP